MAISNVGHSSGFDDSSLDLETEELDEDQKEEELAELARKAAEELESQQRADLTSSFADTSRPIAGDDLRFSNIANATLAEQVSDQLNIDTDRSKPEESIKHNKAAWDYLNSPGNNDFANLGGWLGLQGTEKPSNPVPNDPTKIPKWVNDQGMEKAKVGALMSKLNEGLGDKSPDQKEEYFKYALASLANIDSENPLQKGLNFLSPGTDVSEELKSSSIALAAKVLASTDDEKLEQVTERMMELKSGSSMPKSVELTDPQISKLASLLGPTLADTSDEKFNSILSSMQGASEGSQDSNLVMRAFGDLESLSEEEVAQLGKVLPSLIEKMDMDDPLSAVAVMGELTQDEQYADGVKVLAGLAMDQVNAELEAFGVDPQITRELLIPGGENSMFDEDGKFNLEKAEKVVDKVAENLLSNTLTSEEKKILQEAEATKDVEFQKKILEGAFAKINAKVAQHSGGLFGGIARAMGESAKAKAKKWYPGAGEELQGRGGASRYSGAGLWGGRGWRGAKKGRKSKVLKEMDQAYYSPQNQQKAQMEMEKGIKKQIRAELQKAFVRSNDPSKPGMTESQERTLSAMQGLLKLQEPTKSAKEFNPRVDDLTALSNLGANGTPLPIETLTVDDLSDHFSALNKNISEQTKKTYEDFDIYKRGDEIRINRKGSLVTHAYDEVNNSWIESKAFKESIFKAGLAPQEDRSDTNLGGDASLGDAAGFPVEANSTKAVPVEQVSPQNAKPLSFVKSGLVGEQGSNLEFQYKDYRDESGTLYRIFDKDRQGYGKVIKLEPSRGGYVYGRVKSDEQIKLMDRITRS